MATETPQYILDIREKNKHIAKEYQIPSFIRDFFAGLTAEQKKEVNNWIALNGYSEQIPKE